MCNFRLKLLLILIDSRQAGGVMECNRRLYFVDDFRWHNSTAQSLPIQCLRRGIIFPIKCFKSFLGSWSNLKLTLDCLVTTLGKCRDMPSRYNWSWHWSGHRYLGRPGVPSSVIMSDLTMCQAPQCPALQKLITARKLFPVSGTRLCWLCWLSRSRPGAAPSDTQQWWAHADQVTSWQLEPSSTRGWKTKICWLCLTGHYYNINMLIL